jgi:hypothetical protein
MEWSGQQSQVPQHASQPVVGPVPPPQYPGVNPLQAQAMSGAAPAGAVTSVGGLPDGSSIHPVGASPSSVAAANLGVPLMTQSTAVSVGLDDDTTDVNDTEWVSRAKRAITGTRGDPHRQVQLIQHLRSQYLKQRFGRTVHTDKA